LQIFFTKPKAFVDCVADAKLQPKPDIPNSLHTTKVRHDVLSTVFLMTEVNWNDYNSF